MALVLAIRYVIAFPVRQAVEFATDKWLGVETRGTVHHETALRTLAVGGDPTFYQPVRFRTWKRFMRDVPLEPAKSTFVDLGCGRGRALFFAARSGFHRVVGVELNEQLAREAATNVERWNARRGLNNDTAPEISAVHGDAAHFVPPMGSLLLFLYNPFGPDTMRRVLRTFCSAPFTVNDEVFVVYLRPLHTEVFEEFPQLSLHARRKSVMIYRLSPGTQAGDRPVPESTTQS